MKSVPVNTIESLYVLVLSETGCIDVDVSILRACHLAESKVYRFSMLKLTVGFFNLPDRIKKRN